MLWMINNWKLILGGAALISAFLLGSHIKQNEWDADTALNQLATASVITTSLQENAKLTTTLEMQKNDSQTRIDALKRTIDSQRVLLPQTACASREATASGIVQTTASGELLPVAPASPQASLDRFMAEADNDAREADTLIASCRVVAEWSKAQGSK
jgi:hypothetical protein